VVGDLDVKFRGKRVEPLVRANTKTIEQPVHHLKIASSREGPNGCWFAERSDKFGSSRFDLVGVAEHRRVGCGQ